MTLGNDSGAGKPLPQVPMSAIVPTVFTVVAAAAFLAAYCTSALGAVSAAKDQRREGRVAIVDNAKAVYMLLVLVYAWLSIDENVPAPRSEVMNLLKQQCVTGFVFFSGWSSYRGPDQVTLTKLLFRVMAAAFLYSVALGPILFDLRDLALEPHTVPTVRHWGQQIKSFLYHTVDPLWYMWALATWKAWALLMHECTPTSQLVMSLIMAAFGGYAGMSNTMWLWSHAILLYPIFIIGKHFPLERVLAFRPSQGQQAAGVALLLALLLLDFSSFTIPCMNKVPHFEWDHEVSFLLKKNKISDYEAAVWWTRGFFRLALEFSRMLLFVLFVCPRSYGILTELGSRTLYGLLLHFPLWPFLMRVFHLVVTKDDKGYGLFGVAHGDGVLLRLAAWTWGILLVASCGALMCSKASQTVFGVFLEPRWLERVALDEPLEHKTEKGQV